MLKREALGAASYEGMKASPPLLLRITLSAARSVKVYTGGHVNKEFCIFASFCLTHPVSRTAHPRIDQCCRISAIFYLRERSWVCHLSSIVLFAGRLSPTQAAKLVVVGSEDKRVALYDLNGKQNAAVCQSPAMD